MAFETSVVSYLVMRENQGVTADLQSLEGVSQHT